LLYLTGLNLVERLIQIVIQSNYHAYTRCFMESRGNAG